MTRTTIYLVYAIVMISLACFVLFKVNSDDRNSLRSNVEKQRELEREQFLEDFTVPR